MQHYGLRRRANNVHKARHFPSNISIVLPTRYAYPECRNTSPENARSTLESVPSFNLVVWVPLLGAEDWLRRQGMYPEKAHTRKVLSKIQQ